MTEKFENNFLIYDVADVNRFAVALYDADTAVVSVYSWKLVFQTVLTDDLVFSKFSSTVLSCNSFKDFESYGAWIPSRLLRQRLAWILAKAFFIFFKTWLFGGMRFGERLFSEKENVRRNWKLALCMVARLNRVS